ncbi:uncharacterized protein upd1 [Eurosta solidaginis]|uniref:uncharacterized protein upd1 n=1 Tax=Eurosta solidaginis TaxID=178769 RepID=UPI0035310DE3
MRCGCKSLATNKFIKTAYQNEFFSTKTHPRLQTSVRSPIIVQEATKTITTKLHTHRYKSNLKRRSSSNSNIIRHITLNNNLIIIMTLVTVLASTLAAPSSISTMITSSSTTKPLTTKTYSLPSHTKLSMTATTKRTTTKTATILSASYKNLFVGVAPNRNTIDVSSGMVYTVVPAAVDSSRQRKRHSKRHSNWYDFINFNENKTDLEWVNPCGGFYVPSTPEGGRAGRRKNTKQIFNMLKKSAGNEYKMLKASQQDIDISNIHIWSLHNKTYKFLPKLKSNSTIALKRWYRNIQSYVASFAYLRRIQRAWDMAKLQRENSTARELKLLLFSARRMLCELETAINGTTPALRAMRGFNRLPHVTRNQMNKRLKLYTKRRAERNPKMLQEANTIDLMWVKYYYYDFLETMWKVLRQKTKRRGQVALAQNSKSFNEVSKHFGSISRHDVTSSAAALAHSSRGSSSINNSGKRNKQRLAQMKRVSQSMTTSSSRDVNKRRQQRLAHARSTRDQRGIFSNFRHHFNLGVVAPCHMTCNCRCNASPPPSPSNDTKTSSRNFAYKPHQHLEAASQNYIVRIMKTSKGES